MRIKKVRISGFQRLHEGYASSRKENRASYGNNLFDYLNHCMIAIELDNLTAIETLYLKKITSSLNILDEEYGNFISEKEVDIHQKVNGLLEIHDELVNDTDIDEKDTYIDNILPIGCKMFHVIAVFKGAKITTITGALIEDLFKDGKDFLDIYPGNMIIENKVAEKFYNSFYTFMSEQVTSLDIVTEFMTTKKFYNYADNICSLSYVNTPFGELTFFGNTQDRMNSEIMNIRGSMKTSPYVLGDSILFNFTMKTSFSTFMMFYLSTNYVADHENFKLVFLKENIVLGKPILDKYNARISNCIDYLASFKKGLNDDPSINLNKFNFIFNGTEIIYNLQIPYSRITNFIDLLDTSFDEEKALSKSIMNVVNTVCNILDI